MFYFKFMGLKLFKWNREDNFVLELGQLLKKRIYDKGENLFYKDDPAACFYIIKQGEVGFMGKELKEVPFMKVTQGFVGEYELCKGVKVKRQFTVQAL